MLDSPSNKLLLNHFLSGPGKVARDRIGESHFDKQRMIVATGFKPVTPFTPRASRKNQLPIQVGH
jgi:hypothetical protein